MHILKPANILIPKGVDMSAWSVVACDQFTSEPDYWHKVYELVGDKPSTLHMILPEAELGEKDPKTESIKINDTMRRYLSGGLFTEYKDSFIYVERQLNNGTVRRGIVGALDLEAYDWSDGSTTPVRATEHTVEDRLPPRMDVRKNALLEIPHIMIFVDDTDDILLSSALKGEVIYDFQLMLNGGNIKGWKVADNSKVYQAVEELTQPERLIKKYGTSDNPVLFAIGDGNHSVAAAKNYWDIVKQTIDTAEWDDHPARYALAEFVNIHDSSIAFEPIHKVIFNTSPDSFFETANSFFAGNRGKGKTIDLIAGDRSELIEIGDLTIGQLIDKCEELCSIYIQRFGGRIDYIHGDDECRSMASKPGCAGILLPKMEKSELFSSVIKSGPFPKKSFSIGHGPDKRYYLECRRIK